MKDMVLFKNINVISKLGDTCIGISYFYAELGRKKKEWRVIIWE